VETQTQCQSIHKNLAAYCILLLVQFVSLLHSLPHEDQKKDLLLGLCEPGVPDAEDAADAASSRHFVARRVSFMPNPYGRPVLVVATNEVRELARSDCTMND
jgi:hypothetical protein